MAQNRETRMAITIGQEIYFHGRVRNEAERKFIIYHTFINFFFLICATNTRHQYLLILSVNKHTSNQIKLKNRLTDTIIL